MRSWRIRWLTRATARLGLVSMHIDRCPRPDAFAAPAPDLEREHTLREELADLEAQLTRHTEAIVIGGEMAPLVARMKALDRRRVHVAGVLEALVRVERITPAHVRALEEEILSRLGNWRALLHRHPQQARQMLTKLVTARMRFRPHVEDEERWYGFATECTLGNVVGGVLHSR